MPLSSNYIVQVVQAGALLQQSRYPGVEDPEVLAQRVYAWLEDEQLLDCTITIFEESILTRAVPRMPAPPISRNFTPSFTPTFIGVPN